MEIKGDPARGLTLLHGDEVIAEASAATLDLNVPPVPASQLIDEAAARYSGFDHHIFDTCFVCGPKRKPGEGLRIFTGPLKEGGMVAAPWKTYEALSRDGKVVDPIYLCAALDCPGYFAGPDTRALALLGEMTLHISAPLKLDEPASVLAWPISVHGRKYVAGSAVIGKDGEIKASALSTWIFLKDNAEQ